MPASERLKAISNAMSGLTVPIIDFGRFLNGSESDKHAIAQELLEAARDIGFMYLENINISDKDIQDMFKLAATFFNKPSDYKNAYPYSAEKNSGFIQFGQEKLNPNSEKTDPKEGFNIPKFNGLYGKITDLPPEFQQQGELVQRFARSCSNLNIAILRAFSMCLQIPEKDGGREYLPNRHRYSEKSGDILRLLHYPPTNVDGENRAGGHSDYGTITLLFQQDVGGLEALLRASPQEEPKWVPIPPRKNAIVVNTGDLLEFWTAGLFKSTVHRVVSVASSVSRFSIPYFCQPDDDAPLTPIPSPLLANREIPDEALAKIESEHGFAGGRRETLTAAEHLKLRLSRTYLY
ncbi:hypothetical protein SmJEL517_g02338 [Synchytrium microbalum]|uniref:Fe2OG dioxygenase domain-containing protein n=1 Tax=Synchytrium microbalum TaxID=1806994 RepID=A0A507C824_9FUNG|nr:uncharacterized protein SmJEL517_g02338 [Synchytrium microbalum]TPX35299.1 hypothetical protein SmJEL517_g02338 [Synchytrium microbalum]